MLKQSKVVFYENTHQYFLGDKQLKGITGILSRNLFADKYSDVPDFVLKKAAEKGSMIHASCQQSDMFGICSTKEAELYQKLKAEKGITTIANEYLVSDEDEYATMIDVVGDDYSLYDIKTTASLDKEYLSWQLSINALLFEMQNPGLKAGKLFGIWIRNGKAQLVEVPKIDSKTIERLLWCDSNGIPFETEKPAIAPEITQELARLSELESTIQLFEAEIKDVKEKHEKLKGFLLEQMSKNGVKKWETDNIVVTYVEPTERVSIDSAKIKAGQPDIFEQYKKTSPVKESLRIKIK